MAATETKDIDKEELKEEALAKEKMVQRQRKAVRKMDPGTPGKKSPRLRKRGFLRKKKRRISRKRRLLS